MKIHRPKYGNFQLFFVGPSGITSMHPMNILKLIAALALSSLLMACGSDSSTDTAGSISPQVKSDPFWESWVTPQPDQTPIVEEGKEMADPFKKA